MEYVWVLVFGLICFGALTLGVISVARDPNFWGKVAVAMLRAAAPYFTERNSPEIEKEMQKCTRMGGTWDNFNKVCRFK